MGMEIRRLIGKLLGKERKISVTEPKDQILPPDERDEKIVEIYTGAVNRAIAVGAHEDSVLALKYLAWQVCGGHILTFPEAYEELWETAQRLDKLDDLSPLQICDVVYKGNTDAMLDDIERAYEMSPQIDEQLGLKVSQ